MTYYFSTLTKSDLKKISNKGNQVKQLKISSRNALIRKEYQDGYMPRVLANRYGLSLNQIYRIVR